MWVGANGSAILGLALALAALQPTAAVDLGPPRSMLQRRAEARRAGSLAETLDVTGAAKVARLEAASGDASADGAAEQRQRGGAPAQCQVLSSSWGILVQGLLFAVTVATLLLKWKLEALRRPFWIFLLDSSKQIVGAGAIHCMNLACSMFFSSTSSHGTSDECAWYWVNIMIDTTLGVCVCYGLLKMSENMCGYTSGRYGKGSIGIDWETNPNYMAWLQQIIVWMVIVSIMKLCVVILMWAALPFWIWLSVSCTHWIEDTKARLLFVMIVTPAVMNMFQFIVTDSFIKYDKRRSARDDRTELAR